jgi:ribosomal protein S12 methylthiotransferase accessory factor
MKLRLTIPAETLLEKQPLRSYLKRFLKLNIGWLSRIFGSQIFLEIPESLQELDYRSYLAMDTACSLKKLGILKSIKQNPKIPDEPFVYNYFAQSVEVSAAGTDFISEDKALWKALAETAERYLWINSPDFFKYNVIKAPYRELKGRALDIFSLAGFSELQKKDSKIIEFSENTTFSWMPARSLISSRKIFCPLQLVSGLYFRKNTRTPRNDKQNEPMLRWGITTGLATGRSLEEAVAKGILEIIERDAFMITHLNKLSPPSLDLDNLSGQDEDIAKVLQIFKKYKLDVHLINLPNDFSVNVVLALIIDRTGLGPALSVGASADFDLKTAILDALSESQTIRYSQRNTPADYTDLKDMEKMERVKRLIYWSDLDNLPKIEFLLQGKTEMIDLNKGKNFYQLSEEKSRKRYWVRKLNFLVSKLRKQNYEACYVELTTKEIKRFDLRCVFVVIPQLQPMSLETSIPYLGGNRLEELPKKLGYKPTEELNKDPHPFP